MINPIIMPVHTGGGGRVDPQVMLGLYLVLLFIWSIFVVSGIIRYIKDRRHGDKPNLIDYFFDEDTCSIGTVLVNFTMTFISGIVLLCWLGYQVSKFL